MKNKLITIVLAIFGGMALCADTSALMERIIADYESTTQGRKKLHGAIVSHTILEVTNATGIVTLRRIDHYADGWAWTNQTKRTDGNSWLVNNPQKDPEVTPVKSSPQTRLQQRLKAIDDARKSALAQTNTLSVAMTAADAVKGKRVFSKLKCVVALQEMGVWDTVKAWIEANGLMDLYLAAQVFNESDPYFKQGLKTLQTQLNLTDRQVEELLEKCVAE